MNSSFNDNGKSGLCSAESLIQVEIDKTMIRRLKNDIEMMKTDLIVDNEVYQRCDLNVILPNYSSLPYRIFDPNSYQYVFL